MGLIISRSAVPTSYIGIEQWWPVHTSDRNKAWVQDLYHSTAPVKKVKSLANFNVIRHGKVLLQYQKPQLEFILHGIYMYMYMYVHVPMYSTMY